MANEISTAVKLSVSQGYLRINEGLVSRHSLEAEQAHSGGETIDLTDTIETLLLAVDIGRPGFGYFRNLSDTEHIELSTGAADPAFSLQTFAILYPGEQNLISLSTNTIYARCVSTYGVTGTLKYTLVER